MPNISRGDAAITALTILRELGEHTPKCAACKNNIKNFCPFEMQKIKQYNAMVKIVFKGKK